MADRIKGITIEIDGNANGFQKSIKEVNKSLKATQTDLKDVNKLLKLDPKNTDLLKQKQELLNKAVVDTQKKLDDEKKALEALSKADATDETKRQQELLKREIVETENALKNAKKEASDFGSVFQQQLKVAGDEVKATGEKISGLGEGMTKGVTAPIVALGAGAIASFNEVDKGLDIVVTKTGATGDAMKEFEQNVKNVATSIPTSFEDAGTAIGEVNTRFGLTGDALESLSTQFIQFATINGTDLNGAIDTVQKTMTAFGLSAEDASGFLDVMNKVGQDTGVSMDTLMNGVMSNATVFQELGLSAGESAVLIGQFEKSGADVNVVMGGLSKALKSATAEGKPLDEALKELNDTVLNGDESADGLTKAYELFGKSGAQVFQAVKSGALDFSNLSETVAVAGDSVSNTFNDTLDPADQFEVAMNQLKVLGADIATNIMPILSDAVAKLSEVIQTLSDKWNALSPETQKTIVTIAGIVAVIGPLLVIIGKVVSAIGTLISVGSTIAGVIASLNPIVLAVVAVIGALVAIGVALYKNWDKIKETAQNLMKSIKDAFDNIKKNVTETWNNIKKTTGETWNNMKTTVSNAWNNIKTSTSTAMDNVKTTMSTKFNEAKTNVDTAMNNIKTAMTTKLNEAKSNMATALDGVKTDMQTKLDGAKTIASGIIDAIKGFFNMSGASWSIPDISGVFETAKTTASGIVDAIKGFFNMSGASWSVPDISGVFEGVKTTVSGWVDKIKGLFNFTWELPKFKLPTISVDGGEAPWGILGRGRLPSFSINWNRKAYDNAYMFTTPTVIPTMQGLQGFGDGSGAEIVIGQNKLMNMIAQASGGGTTINMTVNGAKGQNVNQLADIVIDKLTTQMKRRMR